MFQAARKKNYLFSVHNISSASFDLCNLSAWNRLGGKGNRHYLEIKIGSGCFPFSLPIQMTKHTVNKNASSE